MLFTVLWVMDWEFLSAALSFETVFWDFCGIFLTDMFALLQFRPLKNMGEKYSFPSCLRVGKCFCCVWFCFCCLWRFCPAINNDPSIGFPAGLLVRYCFQMLCFMAPLLALLAAPERTLSSRYNRPCSGHPSRGWDRSSKLTHHLWKSFPRVEGDHCPFRGWKNHANG